eukprot:CAMPEP_0171691896 /NCGR_PEP_ID=MMETSP0991-20121206/5785_1 /TAXON_ID=483369 /ORGANISM="non described non described, Strain CCMP2098" /LENGTH=115 /DNA_ID=CAMNT_0012280159 /DNA_START=253 /DNA_END=600 /DNA_ORIENTATION=+
MGALLLGRGLVLRGKLRFALLLGWYFACGGSACCSQAVANLAVLADLPREHFLQPHHSPAAPTLPATTAITTFHPTAVVVVVVIVVSSSAALADWLKQHHLEPGVELVRDLADGV